MLFLNALACCSSGCLHRSQGLCAPPVSAVFPSLAIWDSRGERVTVGVLTKELNNPHRRNLWGVYIFGHESRAFILSFRVRHAVEHWLNGGTGSSRDQAVTFFPEPEGCSQSLLHSPCGLLLQGSWERRGPRLPSVGGRINSFSSSSWSI